MFELYTENARRAIFFARREALARNSPEIYTKDILLGLTYKLYEEECPFEMLHTRRDELRTLMGSSPIEKEPEGRDIPLARDSKLALAYAAEEATRDSQSNNSWSSLETYHLLRGIVRSGDPTAVALNSIGWDINTLRALSKESQLLFPLKRPSVLRILRPYRWEFIITATALVLVAALIFYLRWQQR